MIQSEKQGESLNQEDYLYALLGRLPIEMSTKQKEVTV
jgi:hypothetical protein